MDIAEAISDEMHIFIQSFIDSYDRLGMRASGEWADSLEKEVTATKGVILGKDYTEYLTKGRPPNRDQSPEAIRAWAVGAGLSFIKEWADAKGVQANPIAIAYKIARQGTSWHPQGSDLIEAVLTDKAVQDSMNRIGKKVQAIIQSSLIRDLQLAT